MTDKKSNALEWLMYYGWTIMAGIIALGILFYFYFSPDIDEINNCYKAEFCENYNLNLSNSLLMGKNEIRCLDGYKLQYTFEVDWDEVRGEYKDKCESGVVVEDDR